MLVMNLWGASLMVGYLGADLIYGTLGRDSRYKPELGAALDFLSQYPQVPPHLYHMILFDRGMQNAHARTFSHSARSRLGTI